MSDDYRYEPYQYGGQPNVEPEEPKFEEPEREEPKYEEPQYAPKYDYNYSKPQNVQEPIKKDRRLLKTIALAIVFGMVASVVFQGSNLVVNYFLNDGNDRVADTKITSTEITTNKGTTVNSDVATVAKNVMPAVVSITNMSIQEVQNYFWGGVQQYESQSSGSGIIIGKNDTELLIVTNNHVISDSTELKIQFIDGSIADAKVKGTDSNMDLAVIAVSLDSLSNETISNISIAVLGDSENLKVGEPAIAIGNALGYGQSVTTGVISALNRQIAMSEDGSTTGTLIQTDAAINPGNSGGALLNVRGEVVGINSNKIGGSTIEGMGYAIPISNARPIIEELMNRETKDKVDAAKKGYLGISGLNVTTDVSTMYGMPEGVYVAQVYNGGAYEAGILKGDIITAFDGSSVRTMEDLQGYLEYYEAGESVMVTIQRPMWNNSFW